MFFKINSHDAKKSSSSSSVMHYLEKENEAQKILNQNLILDGRGEEINPYSVEYFFNQDFDINDSNDPNSKINLYEASFNLDNNRGTLNLSQSNFYMINLSPSEKEQKIMESVAVEELHRRGLIYEDIKKDKTALEFFNEQKDQLMKIQMKIYTKEVMDEYAKQMDREIYAHQDKLPSNEKRKKMNLLIAEKYNDFLKEKGFDLPKENNYFEIKQFSINREYEHGNIFGIYSKELDKQVNLFVPKNKFIIKGNALQIEENYFIEKRDSLLEKEARACEQIEIESVESSHSSENFTDYIKGDKVIIKQTYEQFNEELNIYFSSNEVTLKEGVCYVPESIFENKVYNAKSKFLSEKFPEEKEAIFQKNLVNAKFDISKKIDERGKEVFVNKDKVPTKEDLKKIEIMTTVHFNELMAKKGFLPKRKKFIIKDWHSKTKIKADIILESEKAKLLLIEDKRLDEPVQIWVGNFALMEKGKKEIIKDEEGRISINTEFYEDRIQKYLAQKDEKQIIFSDYQQQQINRKITVKNEESIKFSFVPISKENLNIQIKKEDLTIGENGKYNIKREDYLLKYESHLIEHCKKEFSEQYQEIKNKVNKDFIDKKSGYKDKEINRRFKNLLIDKGLLEKEEKDEKYFVKGRVVETKNNSRLISVERNGEEDLRFWVNEKMISEKNKDGLFFKDEKEISKLIEHANKRDLEKKVWVEIPYEKHESELKKYKEEEYKNQIFYLKTKGLKEPVKIQFKESELKIKEDKFFIEKYKLDYKTEKAIQAGIISEYGNVKEDIKNEVWKLNGFDITKRKITGEDLMYYAKIETERKYQHTDKAVIHNKPILKKIKEYQESKNIFEKYKIRELEDQLLKDKYTGEIIKEGVKKGGLNYHSHIVVSRHDKTSVNTRDKVSMSPNANHKEGNLCNGAKIGFNRDDFAKKIEQIFDDKYNYNRSENEKYAYLNQRKKNIFKNRSLDTIKGSIKSKLKKEIYKQAGLNIIKSEIDPRQKIKNQLMPVPIPTSFPKSKIELVVKIVKVAKRLVIDKGLEY